MEPDTRPDLRHKSAIPGLRCRQRRTRSLCGIWYDLVIYLGLDSAKVLQMGSPISSIHQPRLCRILQIILTSASHPRSETFTGSSILILPAHTNTLLTKRSRIFPFSVLFGAWTQQDSQMATLRPKMRRFRTSPYMRMRLRYKTRPWSLLMDRT
jgi:hypothetical protein